MSLASSTAIIGGLVAGVIIAARFLHLGGEVTLELYGPPDSYIVERKDPNVIYTTVGKALLDCLPVAPVDAVLYSATDEEVGRAPLYRADGKPAVGDDARLGKGSRPVGVRDYRFSAQPKILDIAGTFRLRVTCRNDEYDRFVGYYGPLPIPKNGETLRKIGGVPG